MNPNFMNMNTNFMMNTNMNMNSNIMNMNNSQINMNTNFMNMNTNINNMNANMNTNFINTNTNINPNLINMNINMNTNFNNMNNHYFKTPLSFNDFEVIVRLGKGFFGSVYKVKYKLNGQIYAIKQYEKAKAKKEQELDYYREKAILYDLNKRGHPAIVKLYADFEDSTTRNLVMECVEGITLKKKRGKLNGYVPQNEVINILTQLLQTLDFLHTKCHIIHRDIKPDNIIIQNNNQIKLLDFGISVYLENPDKYLVSHKSFKGEMNFVPDEIIFHGFPLNYDYKIDIFSLGFTMYSFMNPSNNENEINLPKKTERKNKNITRKDLYINNTFYDPWLIKFVIFLYHKDQFVRPSASRALEILQKLQFDPNYNYNFESINNQTNINNMNVLFSRQDSSNVINNMNNFNTTIPNAMSNSVQQINTMMPSNNVPHSSVQRVNTFSTLNGIEPLFLNAEMGQEIKVLSSMKSLLQVLLRLDGMDYIQAQTMSLFTDMNIDYSKYFIYSYYQMLNSILPKNLIPNQVAQVIYNQNVNEFIRKVFLNNNSGISGNRPIILFYMIISILKDDFLRYFNHYQNHILDHIIQNNFMSLNSIIPMTDPTIYNSISQQIFEFKNKYKGPLVDNFYFLILSVSRCSRCNNLFGIRTLVTHFLQLDVKNPQNNILDLINNYFAIQNGLKNCKNCGMEVQKMKKLYLLNAPNYLILELEDKNFINFNGNIMLSLFNGTLCQYEYVSAIYKLKINGVTDFVAVFKYNNNLFFYSDDKICSCPQDYINSQCPSLAIFKKISK